MPWRRVSQKRLEKAGGESAYFVRLYRKEACMTQIELAGALDVPQGNLSQIENGKRPVGKALAKKLAKIFQVNYRVFL